MSFLKYLATSLTVVFLAACGGGGGNPGTPSGGTKPVVTPVSTAPVIAGGLIDAAGAATTSISASGYTALKVTLKDPSGLPIASQVIDVSSDATKVIFPEGGAGLTNSAGVAIVKIARASLLASGAGTLAVTFNYKVGSIAVYPDGTAPPTADKAITTYVGFQLSAANITLTNMDAGSTVLPAYGTRQISVQANVNGAPASSTPVQVSFSATCGQVSPSTASTNSSGVAVVSYTATDASGAASSSLGCSGKTVEITASTIGAPVASRSLNIAAAPATNLSFVAVRPSMIFLDNSGGPTQAIAEFKLVNARGEALLGQDVVLTLKNQIVGILKASIGAVGNTTAVTVTTDANGKVSVPVFSGSVPNSVVINAALVSNPAVQTDSAILTIASGRAAQERVSLSLKELAIEGLNLDGTTTDVTLSLADRQGNPVPDGTAVNFVTEGGVMIPPVCYTGGTKDVTTGMFSSPGNSQCSVKIRSQSPRPTNGRVSILAYAAGEEDFVDLNFNNVYDTGVDTFTDLGNSFRDDNENGSFDGGEFSVPRAGLVSSGNNCPGLLGKPGSCDGVWGPADVRKQATIVFASSQAIISALSQTATSLTYSVSDINGNSMPTGSKISVTAASSSGNCIIVSGGSNVLPNTLSPASFSTGYVNCANGDTISVSVTSPSGTVTTRTYTVVVATPTPASLNVSSGSTMTLFNGDVRSSTVTGGSTPYSISQNAASKSIITVDLSGAALKVTGKAVGTASFDVKDSAGGSYTVTVTVN